MLPNLMCKVSRLHQQGVLSPERTRKIDEYTERVRRTIFRDSTNVEELINLVAACNLLYQSTVVQPTISKGVVDLGNRPPTNGSSLYAWAKRIDENYRLRSPSFVDLINRAARKLELPDYWNDWSRDETCRCRDGAIADLSTRVTVTRGSNWFAS